MHMLWSRAVLNGSRPCSKALYQAHAEPAAALPLQARCEAQVVSWRGATASMGYITPYPRESSGTPPPRWVADAKADARKHVQHGLDEAGRIVFERSPSGRIGVWLHAPGRRQYLSFHEAGRINAAWEFREEGGRLQALDLVDEGRGIDRTCHWEGDRLLREVMCN
ncbi:hypothetical protein DCO49_04875 [Stenotrophomonas sp. SPM]|nr:hypothetical protein DCO49_04875 [Stenotrophomonas sp. SPM]